MNLFKNNFQSLVRSIGFRRSLVFIFDQVAIGLSFYGAFLLRFDFHIPDDQIHNLLQGLPWIYVTQSLIFVTQGLYRGLWSFASIRDLFVIMRGVSIAAVCSLTIISLVYRLTGWPRAVFLLDAVLLIMILGGGRFTYRFLREVVISRSNRQKRILVIGAGHSANIIAREFYSRPELSARIMGFLDDNSGLKKARIQGAPVLGKLSELGYFLDKFGIHEVIIAIPSLPGKKIREILSEAQQRSIPCRICPPIRDVLLGRVGLSQLREINVEDLLRRDAVTVDDSSLNQFVTGKVVLVTGAGGSIGSQLCRQLLKYAPKTLVLYERSEYNLYRFEQELRSSKLSQLTNLEFVIGDVLDGRKLNEMFATHRPNIVFHAAAYKHVPLMEENIYEAIQNNVVGTYQVAQTAARFKASNFVMISTDKAVRPTSVMGATKRMAERVVTTIGKEYAIKTSVVRFGNVLNSEGSVIPRFRDQISKGGPVTVTHPDITRYFMTIPEACLLVLQSSILGNGGEVFLLDMGEPILIRELAEELIKLSGLTPYKDIDIIFTGLRKGEKLYEELLINLDECQRTVHPKIMFSPREMAESLPSDWNEKVLEFIEEPAIPSDEKLRQWIFSWVSEYCPSRQDGRSSLLEAPVTRYPH